MKPSLPVIAIVTPFLAGANNGNWRTAHRWQTLLQGHYKVFVGDSWPLAPHHPVDAMIALHARRSADSVELFHRQYPEKPLIVTLTGTDIYRDVADNAAAQSSIAVADALVVLQEDAISMVPQALRRKTHVIFQSAKPLLPAQKAKGKLDCVVVGHLRPEKDPQTVFRLAGLIPPAAPIQLLHIGAAQDDQLAAEARRVAAKNSHYHWAGAMTHGLTRAAIKRAHLLIHPSVMEGGANVIVEAISAGTPVLASHISGNIGMLGKDYEGYFPVGDAHALWLLLERCLKDSNFLSRLRSACAARAVLFKPETECARLCQMLGQLLQPARQNRL